VNFLLLGPPVPAAPNMLAAAINGECLTVSIPAQAGFAYQLGFKNNLSDPGWIPLGNSLSGTGIQWMTDPVGAGARFYRIRIQ